MKKLAITALILAGLAGAEIYRSNCFIDVEHITVIRADLPAAFDGYKIAHISDLHGYTHGINNIDLCGLIQRENVDIIVITGDLINDTSNVPMVYETIANLVSIAPVYYVHGNHEYGYGGGWRDVERELERTGAVVLKNRAVELWSGGDGITLLGVDDPLGNADMLSLEATVELAKQREPNFIIMLHHRYERAKRAADAGIHLMLAGHAHGGLIRLPFTDGLVGPSRVLFPKNTNGLYDISGMSLITSRGLGNAGISFRLFNQLHLPIITLTCE